MCLKVSIMKSQLIVCFSVLVAITVIMAVMLLTVERGPAVSNGDEPVNFERDVKDETVCSDNTEDGKSVNATRTTAPQVRPQLLYYLNGIPFLRLVMCLPTIIMTNKLLP